MVDDHGKPTMMLFRGRPRAFFPVTAFAGVLGRSTKAIQRWEHDGLLPPAPRIDSNRGAKLYSADHIESAYLILKKLGLLDHERSRITESERILAYNMITQAWRILLEGRDDPWDPSDTASWNIREDWDAPDAVANEDIPALVDEVMAMVRHDIERQMYFTRRLPGPSGLPADTRTEMGRRNPYQGIEPWSENFDRMKLAD